MIFFFTAFLKKTIESLKLKENELRAKKSELDIVLNYMERNPQLFNK